MSTTRPLPQSAADWPEIKMYGYDFREQLHTMYQVITARKLWKKFKGDPGTTTSFMFSRKNYINEVAKDKKVVACKHSGVTFAYAMQIMRQIAQEGWDQFYKIHSSNLEENTKSEARYLNETSNSISGESAATESSSYKKCK